MRLGRTARNSSSVGACGCVRRDIPIIKRDATERKRDDGNVNIFQSDRGLRWHESVGHGEEC